MPYTHEKASNINEDKNTIKSRTYFHSGPNHKTSAQDKTLTECVIVNKNIFLVHRTIRPVPEKYQYEYAYRDTPSICTCPHENVCSVSADQTHSIDGVT